MPYASLRDFITRLEAAGRLQRVTAPVSPFLEMTEIQTRLLAERGPAVLFENVVRDVPSAIAMPLNWFLIPPAPALSAPGVAKDKTAAIAPPRGAMPILAFYFCTTAFVTGALQAHLLRFLETAGASEAAAIIAGTLVGPAQVAARLFEFGLMRALHPVWSARIAALLHPLGAGLLGALGPAGIAAFAIAYGAGNGMITIARGTLPLAIFGPSGYGLRTSLLSVPARLSVAAAPFLFGLLLDRVGVLAVLLTVGLNLSAFASLWLLRQRQPRAVARAASD